MRIPTPIRTTAAALAIAASLPPATSAAGDIVIRRDGSKAVSVPADTTPDPTTPKAAEGFDWSDAGVGAGTAALAIALGAGGAFALLPMRATRKEER